MITTTQTCDQARADFSISMGQKATLREIAGASAISVRLRSGCCRRRRCLGLRGLGFFVVGLY